MTSNELFQLSDSIASLDGNRGFLRLFFLEQLERYKQQPAKGEDVAYGIAGLLGAQSVIHLPECDPYLEIIHLAGDLELPSAHRESDSTWEKFAVLVGALPMVG